MASIDDTSDSAQVKNNDETLIVLAAPSVKNTYYSAAFQGIIDYMVNFVQVVRHHNDIVILVDKATMSYFNGKVPNDILIEANIDDIWIRDFAPVFPSQQIKFRYAPKYHRPSLSQMIESSFEQWFLGNNLSYKQKSDLILDGGNVVENPEGSRVVITERILTDNPQLTKADVKSELQRLLNTNEIAIIPEVPDDTTGHADGMVMWVSNTKLLLQEMSEPEQKEILNELKNSFPGVEIIEVPDYYQPSTWKGFTSACNIFVNSLVTDDYIYMPTFNGPHDQSMLELIQSHTKKKVIPVPAEKVCFMGGSVRCLTWQVKGHLKEKIVQLTKSS